MRDTEEKLRGPANPTLFLERRLYEHKKERRAELTHLDSAPYFFRCDANFADASGNKTIYFGKHAFTDADIYSWVSPAAALRFEEPGEVRYDMPDGAKRAARLLRKDQYLIVDGHITFMATETSETPRTLVHQEHFTGKKRGFMLPDIVAQMEKAQDAVIRAPHRGSFLISGPAGSGKTTLALHRVAYLAQNPDTAPHFPHEEIIVFVQNESSKAYFGALLAELGIRRATLTTYHEWAMRLLKLDGHTFAVKWSGDDRANDEYLAAKKAALAAWSTQNNHGEPKNPFAILEKIYAPHLDDAQQKKFAAQKTSKMLDRFDLVALLKLQIATEGRLREDVEYYDKVVRGKLRKSVVRTSVEYALIIVDEAENWLAEELKIARGCLNQMTEAVIYVGDLAQQTQFGTIRDWGAAGEQFAPDRKALLHKVYRNTRQILEYVRGCGYEIEIPNGIAEGPNVREVRCASSEEETAYCAKIIAESGDALVGVIAKQESRLAPIRELLLGKENVKIFSVNEAQGLEFDTVIVLGSDDFESDAAGYADPLLAEERRRINHDLRYVALTRAMRELHVVK